MVSAPALHLPPLSWLPDGCSRIFKLYVFGPSGIWTMAQLRCPAKFDPFLSLEGIKFCHLATLAAVGAQRSSPRPLATGEIRPLLSSRARATVGLGAVHATFSLSVSAVLCLAYSRKIDNSPSATLPQPMPPRRCSSRGSPPLVDGLLLLLLRCQLRC